VLPMSTWVPVAFSFRIQIVLVDSLSTAPWATRSQCAVGEAPMGPPPPAYIPVFRLAFSTTAVNSSSWVIRARKMNK
jgi:hypothetical protein